LDIYWGQSSFVYHIPSLTLTRDMENFMLLFAIFDAFCKLIIRY
jgi:hypothetical protein